MPSEIHLARQPILDARQRVFGYELLYRLGPNSAGEAIADPDFASRTVIERAMLDWGMERIIGDRFGLVNASPSLIVSGTHRALPPEGVIIELREDHPLTEEERAALHESRRDGFHFALDNVTSVEQLDASGVLPLASMVKVELSQTDELEVLRIVERVRATAPSILLVAEKVETARQFEVSEAAGFDLFEGFFFARPEVLSRTARPAASTSAMALLATLQDENVRIDEVEELIGADPSLAYRILAVVNSSAFGLNRRVDSIRHAIVLLGVTQIRHLATLLTLSSSADGTEALISLGAVRARLAGSLVADPDLAHQAFTVGLLSVTPALYSTPIEELVAELPLSDAVSDALVTHAGPLGRVLELVLAVEQLDVERIESLAPGRSADIRTAYGEAAAWADGFRSQINGNPSAVRLPTPPKMGWAPPDPSERVGAA